MKSNSIQNEPDLHKQITKGKRTFKDVFGSQPATISRAPGRAEIIGCHTDYNHGLALGAAISRSTLGFFRKRDDETIQVFSTAYPGKPILFSIDNIKKDNQHSWTNYVRAVVAELIATGHRLGGADILIDSTVPKGGGVSSSAALELAVAYGLLALYGQPIDPVAVASLCQRAENGKLVASPCGFLDQGTAAFAKKGNMVFLDFLPKGTSPVSKIENVEVHLDMNAASFVIAIDPAIERQLGTSGFVERRRMCEESLVFWTKMLNKSVSSLRDVTAKDFRRFRDKLEAHNSTMRKRVEHVIYENERVLAAVGALLSGDTATFGTLLTQSGTSGLELFELDERTPELTFLVTRGRTMPGVVGMRNMGGGFSAVALALVERKKIETFQNKLEAAYHKAFGRSLQFIEFSPAQGTEVLYEI